MVKILRLAYKTLDELNVQATHIVHDGHYRFTLTLPGGAVRRITLAGTPRVVEVSISNFGKSIRNMLTHPSTCPKGKP